jgi:mono/diheme cytochrome c family protein
MTKRFLAAGLMTVSCAALALQKAEPRPAAPAAAPTAPPAVKGFLNAHCYACHSGDSKSGGLDLTTLSFELRDPKSFSAWVKIHDRVRAGEMPPPAAEKLSAGARAAFVNAITPRMVSADLGRERREGRSVRRRLNRFEYENTLRDLLGAPWLQLREMLPEDGQRFRFNKVGEALDVSSVQMSSYLTAADYALREAMLPGSARPESKTRRFYARAEGSFTGPADIGNFRGAPERATFLLLGNGADHQACNGGPMTVSDKDPARRDQEGVGMISSSYEPLQPDFGHFRATVSGFYKVRLCANSFWAQPESEKTWWRASRENLGVGRTTEPVTLYTINHQRQMRKLGSVDIGPETKTVELNVYLDRGETIRPDAVRYIRSRPPEWRNPLATKDGQPGVDFRYLEVEGPINSAWPPVGQKLLFGDLPIQPDKSGGFTVVSTNESADANRLIRGFLTRAYRRPVANEDVQAFQNLYVAARTTGMGFGDALLTVYSGVLCSPEFLTLVEAPGPLDDRALAERLAYFLWNSEPDAVLRDLAARNQLRKPGVLHAQVERMLADPRAERFVDAFLDYWLDLRKVNNNSPDERLYPDYYLDDFLVESSIDETRAFFGTLVHDNLPARNIVDSNFVTVNERLAQLYGLPGVEGTRIRRVTLPADSPRGGLLTQASVLKVTANGTTTSPVIRGAWITERILGQPVPPPPPSVPAIEPDTRGATTIREQLAKHRTQPTCKACHAKIDPPGFALESFDVCGGWRDHYRALGDGSKPKVPGRGKNGNAFAFSVGPPVDATGALADGRAFQDVRDLKKLFLKDDRQIARNLTRQFVVYGTGAPVGFGDRDTVETILDRTRPTGYGVRSLLHAIIESDLFENK